MTSVVFVKQVLLRSGTAWVLWLLGLSLLLTLAVIIERVLFFRKRDCDLGALARRLALHLAGRHFPAAINELARSKSMAAAIAAAGLELAAAGPAAADKAMQSAVALERRGLERWLAYLGTLGNNAPFIGLFGTVIGVIGAFEDLGHRGGHGVAATDATWAASQMIMTSISEALVATAAGILVALPAVISFNYFQRRIAALLAETEVLSNLVLAYLSQSGHQTE